MVDIKISDTPIAYEDALGFMEERVAAIHAGTADECLWFLEHPPLYTAGTSAQADALLDANRFPIYQAGRGGQYTYHGPGQRVVYVMLDLNRRGRDIRSFVRQIESWIIAVLARFNVSAYTDPARIGVWVDRPEGSIAPQPAKIAAIGIRIKKWVSLHGLSLNVEPDLSHFDGIIPCGISDRGVTSLVDLGRVITLAEVDTAFLDMFAGIFDAPLSEVDHHIIDRQ